MLRLAAIAIFTLSSSLLFSQELFEHLTHKDGYSQVVSYLPTDEGIFYHDNSGATKIKFIDYENNIDVLWTSGKFQSFWSEFKKLDGEDWVLYMSNIVDYDLILNELWVFKYIDGQLSEEMIQFEEGPYYFDGASDMQYINENSVLIVIANYLVELNENHEVVNYVQHDLGYGAVLNENQFNEKYMTGRSGKIYIIDSNLELFLKNDTGFEITHFSSLGDNKTMVGTEQSIIIYNSDCTSVITSLDAPSGGEFKNFVSLLNFDSYALEKLNDEYLVWHISPEGNFSLLHSESCDELEYTEIAFHDDFIYQVGIMKRLAYFKTISSDPGFDDEILRPEITLNDFQVFLKEEYSNNGVLFNDYYYELEWTNNGSTEINAYDLYISYFPSLIMPTLGAKVSTTDTLIASGETVSLNGWITINRDFASWINPNYEPNELFFPGANNLPICRDNIIEDEDVLNNDNLDERITLDFNLFPNPTENYIQLNNIAPREIIFILDTNGQKVWFGYSDSNTRRVDVSSFPPGLYTVTNGSLSQSFVKH